MCKVFVSAVILWLFCALPSFAKGECTIVMNVVGNEFVHESGEICHSRYSPASTFKFPIALMGFEEGVLSSAKDPLVPYDPKTNAYFKSWRTDVWPSYWLKHSVIWYSQFVTKAIGREKFSQYVSMFDYGNEDATGELTGEDGLVRAWLSSSLEISPHEQALFLSKVVKREFSLTENSYEGLVSSAETFETNGGLSLVGKTGTGFRLKPDATRSDVQFGWFVGWVEKNSQVFVFVKLVDDGVRRKGFASSYARKVMLKELDGLLLSR